MEIVKSLSVKINLGNYENIDYFVSIKDECEEKDLEAVGEKLREYCKEQLVIDMNATKKFWADKLNKKADILEEEIK